MSGRSVSVFASLLMLACARTPAPMHPRAVALQAAGVEALGGGALDRAAGHFALALEYEPRLAEAENGLGLVALRRGDWARAEAHFREALARNEELAEAHANLATVLLHRDAEEEALGEARAALAIDPGYADARLIAGELLLRLGRLGEARWELEKLCAAAPARADAHAANALVLLRLGRAAAAEEEAQTALRLDPKLPAAHRARAELLRHAGDLEAATAELDLVIAANPGSVPDRLARATIVAARGHWDDAAAELEALVEAAPRRAEVRFAIAFVALRRAQVPAALRAADAALALRAAYPEARLVRAEALLRLRRPGEARRELERFLADAPDTMRADRARVRALLDDDRRLGAEPFLPGSPSSVRVTPMALRVRTVLDPDRDDPDADSRVVDFPDAVASIRIGRRKDLELPLPFRALSAVHARMKRDPDGRWSVEDLGSLNGTELDGEPLVPGQPRPLSAGSRLGFGVVLVIFDGPVTDGPPTPATGAEGTGTIARRLVNDLVAGDPGAGAPTLTVVRGARPATLRLDALDRRYVAGRSESAALRLVADESLARARRVHPRRRGRDGRPTSPRRTASTSTAAEPAPRL